MSGNRIGGLRFALGLRLGQGMLYFTTLSLRCGRSGGILLTIGFGTTLILSNFLYCSTKLSKVCWEDVLTRVEVLIKGVLSPLEVVFLIGIIVEVVDGESIGIVVNVVFCFTAPLEIISVIDFLDNYWKIDGWTGTIVGKLLRCKTWANWIKIWREDSSFRARIVGDLRSNKWIKSSAVFLTWSSKEVSGIGI